MPDTDEITEFQSFTERTLKFGRNLMAAAVPIILFAWVDALDIRKFEPFGYEIQKGDEILIWGMLLGVLLYYGVRFVGLAIPDILEWLRVYGAVKNKLSSQLKTSVSNKENESRTLAAHRSNRDQAAELNQDLENLNTLVATSEKNLKNYQNSVRSNRSEYTEYWWRRMYFWLTDAGLPAILIIAAVISAIIKIDSHLPAGSLQSFVNFPSFLLDYVISLPK